MGGAMPYKITVIEDNEPDIFLLEDVLEQNGLNCTLTSVADGLDARNHFSSIATPAEAPDLILLDLNLPKVSGTELLEFIRGREPLAQVPIVVWSSARSEREQKALDQFRITRFIVKPTSYQAFLKIGPDLREILEGAQPRG